MRPALRYALAATVVLVLLAQWWPQGTPALVGAAGPGQPQLVAARASSPDAAPMTSQPLPARLDPLDLESSGRDPFVPWRAQSQVPPFARAAAPSPPAVMALPGPVSAPPSAPPVAPQQALRYLGFFSSPAGQTVLLLADGEVALPVSVGTLLPNGYVVQSLGPEAVRLLYAPTATTVDIPLPAAAFARR